MRGLKPPGENTSHTPIPRPSWARVPEPYYYVVRGRGFFPDDMLRYDRAWAVTGTNFGGDHALAHEQKERSVVVACWAHALTDERWNSFGWGVIDKHVPKPAWLP